MPKTCDKVGYPTQLSAKLALLRIRRTGKQTANYHVKRAYLCPYCHAWHLTSKSRGGRVRNA